MKKLIVKLTGAILAVTVLAANVPFLQTFAASEENSSILYGFNSDTSMTNAHGGYFIDTSNDVIDKDATRYLKLHYDNLSDKAAPEFHSDVNFSLNLANKDNTQIAFDIYVNDPERLAAIADFGRMRLGFATKSRSESGIWDSPRAMWSDIDLEALKSGEWCTVYLPMNKAAFTEGFSQTGDVAIKSVFLQPGVSAGGEFELRITNFRLVTTGAEQSLFTINDNTDMGGGGAYQIAVIDDDDVTNGEAAKGQGFLGLRYNSLSNKADSAWYAPVKFNIGNGGENDTRKIAFDVYVSDPSRLIPSGDIVNGLRVMMSNSDETAYEGNWSGSHAIWNTVDLTALAAGEWRTIYLPLQNLSTNNDFDITSDINSMFIQPAISAGGAFELRIRDFRLVDQNGEKIKDLYKFDMNTMTKKSEAYHIYTGNYTEGDGALVLQRDQVWDNTAHIWRAPVSFSLSELLKINKSLVLDMIYSVNKDRLENAGGDGNIAGRIEIAMYTNSNASGDPIVAWNLDASYLTDNEWSKVILPISDEQLVNISNNPNVRSMKIKVDVTGRQTQERNAIEVRFDNLRIAENVVGNLNGDSKIDANDLVLMRQTLLTGSCNDFSVIEKNKYDTKSDGQINIIDLVRLKKLIAVTVTEN